MNVLLAEPGPKLSNRGVMLSLFRQYRLGHARDQHLGRAMELDRNLLRRQHRRRANLL